VSVTSDVDELRWPTPAGWADAVLADEVALLDDHAHLEREAARNALNLMTRVPRGVDPGRWTARLNGVARDEVAHLGTVLTELADRGVQLSVGHTNPYARGLRDLVRRGDAVSELVDRLLVSALIELRSCERFRLLGATGHVLAPLYARLEASEAGHHRLFVQLAAQADDEARVATRWVELLDAEADVARAQPPGPRLHSGVGPAVR
jgi:tRNA 2-(methylsulfanyl)-N6-isopentenyladenosine37 hydroxylase